MKEANSVLPADFASGTLFVYKYSLHSMSSWQISDMTAVNEVDMLMLRAGVDVR
jgi:hypothetical protein